MQLSLATQRNTSAHFLSLIALQRCSVAAPGYSLIRLRFAKAGHSISAAFGSSTVGESRDKRNVPVAELSWQHGGVPGCCRSELSTLVPLEPLLQKVTGQPRTAHSQPHWRLSLPGAARARHKAELNPSPILGQELYRNRSCPLDLSIVVSPLWGGTPWRRHKFRSPHNRVTVSTEPPNKKEKSTTSR